MLDDNGFILAESNAILAYLAKGTKFLPDDRKKFGVIFQWLFFEQYSHEPYIATSRFWIQHKPDSPEKTALLASKRDGGWAALKMMEEHLAKNDFFVGDYYHRRYRPVRLYPCLARRRVSVGSVSKHPQMDRPHEGTARICTNDDRGLEQFETELFSASNPLHLFQFL